jgi:uncharacterized protein
MSDGVLAALVKKATTGGAESVSFCWQGGEPTLMGLPFYEKATALQARHGAGVAVVNSLQTNGVLLDRGWAGFLRRHRFLVGLSIDGPRHVHDRCRVFGDGRPSWALVVDRAKLLLDAGVAVNALTVVNDYAARFPQELYEFHKENGLRHMQFVPCAADVEGAGAVSAAAYGQFLTTLFDLWLADFDGLTATTSVRFFDALFHRYVGLEPPDCTLGDTCGPYLVVEHDGDVFSCDFFVRPEGRLGNLMEDDLAALFTSQRHREFGRTKADIPVRCVSCRWGMLCRGGCPKDRLTDAAGRSGNRLCAAYETFFSHADARFRGLADRWLGASCGDTRSP